MLHLFTDDRPWFRARKIGYGSGLPIAWQGWVLLGSYIAAVAGIAGWLANQEGQGRIAFYVLPALVPAAFMLIARHKTEGGWRWRKGGK